MKSKDSIFRELLRLMILLIVFIIIQAFSNKGNAIISLFASLPISYYAIKYIVPFPSKFD